MGNCDLNQLIGGKLLSWFTGAVQEQEQVQATKLNIIQSGAFSREYIEEVMGALTSLKMTVKFILQPDGLAYFISDPTSDAQLNAMKEYLDRRDWWYEHLK
ncbi:N-acetylmuramoyl-L-alanine amidase [Bacillus wiedmannii]|uniref:N-acetylmuramoyl-L-alanine amidase n=1 Tax=Bacillus wiedmannii TaxID=1890302 RepID=A0A2B5GDT2_9BACI|nr:N-acetylmuramoyl-L-alanine amidase [Bacillus wiedmannii]PEL17966.1 N-acetylmuramoyl-L-alanine amidase [Bacillus wiedmannii]PEM10875.1 N-acetylmuramoyl-L-alanine amidase [Bacillus wiedmannii]PEM53173.1 N-acetylmuramoyl-L-alanine amidase [Bacillus wiedmannii]PFY97948.1 N-acetylmuramoyl-L-alanine amidase [Bacillus wiedmannii]